MKEEYSPDGEMKKKNWFLRENSTTEKRKVIPFSSINEVSQWRNQAGFFWRRRQPQRKRKFNSFSSAKDTLANFLSLKANEGFIGSNTEVRLVCRSREYKYRSKVYQAAKNIKKQRERIMSRLRGNVEL